MPTSTRAGDLRAQALGIASVVVTLIGLYMAFEYAPMEATQGQAQRIFYVHLPVALLAYLAFIVIFIGSVGYLWKRGAAWDRLARSSAEIGFVFTTLVLATGSIWGRPIWGTWWTWDARLTTTLILWFIYLGYFMVRAYAGDRERAARYAAIVGIIGAVDLPIIHLSVKWWRTLHPQPIVLTESPALPDSMLVTALVCVLGFMLLYAYLMLLKWRVETARDLLAERELSELLRAAPPEPQASTRRAAVAAGEVSGGSED